MKIENATKYRTSLLFCLPWWLSVISVGKWSTALQVNISNLSPKLRKSFLKEMNPAEVWIKDLHRASWGKLSEWQCAQSPSCLFQGLTFAPVCRHPSADAWIHGFPESTSPFSAGRPWSDNDIWHQEGDSPWNKEVSCQKTTGCAPQELPWTIRSHYMKELPYRVVALHAARCCSCGSWRVWRGPLPLLLLKCQGHTGLN